MLWVLMTLLAGSSDQSEARAEESPPFARGLKFLFPAPKNYHNVSLFVSEGQMPKAKSSSWRNAQKWSCREEKQGWLLYTSIDPDAEILPGERPKATKLLYLAYRTTPPKRADEKGDVPLVFMSDVVEPHCYWAFEQYQHPERTRLRFQAKACSGDFKDY